MEDIDDLVRQMSETVRVDPASLGEHPRFSQYKYDGKVAVAQAKRREEAWERQRNGRDALYNRLRNLGGDDVEEELEESTEQQMEELNDTEQTDDSKEKKCRRRARHQYSNTLMLSEWLIDIPEELSSDWLMVASPVGKRNLVVASHGRTRAFNKSGKQTLEFTSYLPGGGEGKARKALSSRTVLDCILTKDGFYCLDILVWDSNILTEYPFDNRQFLLHSRLEENDCITKPLNKKCKPFMPLPYCKCEKDEMIQFVSRGFNFELDGLLFYHSQVLYEPGQSALVGWLKPFMLPELLNVPVPAKYITGETSQKYIKAFNYQHGHKSRVAKTSMEE